MGGEPGGGLDDLCGNCGQAPAALGRAWCWECLEDHLRWLTSRLNGARPAGEGEGYERQDSSEKEA